MKSRIVKRTLALENHGDGPHGFFENGKILLL